jgi:exopolysaccharide biosynthesis polyprenyl glycosylphosphotransferase
LEGTGIVDLANRQTAFRQVFEQLRTSIRETDVIGWYKQNGTLAVLFSDLNSADKMVVNTVRTKVSNAVTVALTPDLVRHIRISVHLFPKNNDLGTGTTDLTFYPDLPYQYRAKKAAHVMKRLMDIGGSLFLLSLLGPLLALIAVVIKVSSKGPVIFRQLRVGQHGNLFSFWKFRSMYLGSDATIHKEYVTKFISHGQPANEAGAVYKLTDDPRITPVGRFLRKTSLDELPQLWNVLCGDMSLVGPRPPLPYEFECYALWHRRRILEVKPGITGLWQVMGRSRISFNDMVRLDLKYVQQWSIWLDIRILLQTPKAVLMGEGAY